MNEYERISRQTRQNVSRLTLAQQRDVLRLYDDSIKSLSERAKKAGDKTLSKRWLMDYQKELTRVRAELARELNKSIRSYTTKAAQEAVKGQGKLLSTMFERAELDVGDHFTTALSQVQKNVVADIISGGLYKDNKALSNRIWQATGDNKKDIETIIAQGITEKKSATKLAEDLEQFVKPAAERPSNWGKAYPMLAYKNIGYNAMRLARTSINHAYQNATIQSSGMNPFVEGIEWQSALIHGRTCQICIDRHGQIFPKDNVPLDHPNGLCTMIPHIPKDLDAVADELKEWIDGGDNLTLDKWYKEYGENFSGLEPAKDLLEKTQEHKVIEGGDLMGDYKFDPNTSGYDFDIEDIINRQGYDGLPRVVDEETFKRIMEESNFYSERSYSADSVELLKEYQEQLYNGKFYVDASEGGAQYGQGMYVSSVYDIADEELIQGISKEMLHYRKLGEERGFGHAITEAITIDPSAKIFTIPKGQDANMYVNSKYRIEFYKKFAEGNEVKKVKQLEKSFNDWVALADNPKATPAQYRRARNKFDDIAFSLDESTLKKKMDSYNQPFINKEGNRVFKNIGTKVAEMGYDVIKADGHGESGSYSVILNRTKIVIKKGGVNY